MVSDHSTHKKDISIPSLSNNSDCDASRSYTLLNWKEKFSDRHFGFGIVTVVLSAVLSPEVSNITSFSISLFRRGRTRATTRTLIVEMLANRCLNVSKRIKSMRIMQAIV